MNQTAPRLKLLYFAAVREKIGLAGEDIALPPAIANLAALRAHLAIRHPILAQQSVKAAVNQQFAGPETPVYPGDEVAFFPPVTGG